MFASGINTAVSAHLIPECHAQVRHPLLSRWKQRYSRGAELHMKSNMDEVLVAVSDFGERLYLSERLHLSISQETRNFEYAGVRPLGQNRGVAAPAGSTSLKGIVQ